ncbi:hypothetical protein NW762_007918 [Fusarium torreyae]|uniref:F-box domain-containing protein n=1 Tax=Fusarium torreyae TaxID=1237075 RepID=A0A9W8RWN5_9HYPO|nr:hypothetical protein NW762_007918 [Fusarium torreyae]
MSTRRSARLRGQAVQEPAIVHPSLAVEEPKKSTKRKAPATKIADKSVAKVQKKAAGSTASKAGKASASTPASSTGDALSILPSEILNLILNFSDTKSLGRLSKTSKSYYALVTPQLYRRINVAVNFHAHIAKLIRTLDPHLTIEQRKQLKKEGQYKGQQEKFSSKLDPRKKPEIADHVRQILLGIGDPGKKHRFIVHRYAEEALKNMKNLEIVETMVATDINLLQGLIFNSRSTLRSLAIHANSYFSRFLQDWERNAKEMGITLNSKHDLTSLKSFSLTGASIESEQKESLGKAIDFVELEELKLGYMSDDLRLLANHLSDVFSAAHNDPTRDIKLRKLYLDVSSHSYSLSDQEKEVILDSRLRFVSSFDTLTSLVLKDYNEYPDSVQVNPDLQNSHLQAILKHENLTKLEISYRGRASGYKIPFLSPNTVNTLIDNLPKLEEVMFAPDAEKLDEIGKILARALSLTSISLYPCGTYEYGVDREAIYKSVLKSIVDGVFYHSIDRNTGKFKWEDHSKIRRVEVDFRVYELGSKFGKAKKGMQKAERFTTELSAPSKQKREVFYRDITNFVHGPIESGFDPECEWINKVEKDLD